MNETQVNATRASLLFAADKARKAADLLQRLSMLPAAATARDSVRSIETSSRLAAESLTIDAPVADSHKEVVKTALHAYADDLNRKVQLLQDRYNIEAATDLSDRLLEVDACIAGIEAAQAVETAAAA